MGASEHSKLLSPSSMGRVLSCPGSVKASSGIPEQTTLFSEEGSDAHQLAEIRLKEFLGDKQNFDAKTLNWYSQEMEDYISGYVAYVSEKIEFSKQTCKNPQILIEQRVKAPRYDEGLFGTTDVSIIADNELTIIDLKYGKGVPVNAKENVQEMIYAICCLETFGSLYDIQTVNLCIYQPRLSAISEWGISVEELYKWAEEILKPGIQKVHDGVEEFNPSKYCQFCKAKPLCKALRDKNLELAKHEFRPAFLMADSEVEDVLDKAEDLISWLNSVKDYALEQAISGTKFERYKLVEGRSNRKWTDEDEVAKVVKDAGFNPYEIKLLSVTSMQSLIGKKKFEELLNSYIFKPKGKLTLAKRDEDKRPEVTTAELDFKDINEKGEDNNE